MIKKKFLCKYMTILLCQQTKKHKKNPIEIFFISQWAFYFDSRKYGYGVVVTLYILPATT